MPMRYSSNGLNGTMRIGEAAQRAALIVDTIRFYERRSLLPEPPRTSVVIFGSTPTIT
jgi:MerR family regulatory protein